MGLAATSFRERDFQPQEHKEKMVLKRILPLAIVMATSPAFSQVQLFEAEVSGIVPHAGISWNSGITQYVAGFEYTIDGRTTLGFDYAAPLKDTLTFDPDLKSYTVHPYGEFEFIEPDNLKTFSFAMRVDFIHEDTRDKPSGTPAAKKYNSFSRTWLGGGPVFALRIFSSERLALIPAAGYEAYYVTWRKDFLDPATNGASGTFKEDNNLWHDVSGSCAVHFILNEFNGITFEPKIVARFGDGLQSSDLLNVSASLGYVLAF
jgi:hypothetical protein